MKISTATSALVNYSLEAAVAIVSETGFDGVDIWCGRPHLYRQDHSATELQRLKQQLKESGLAAVTAMPAFFRYPYSLSSPNAVIRSDSIQYVVDCMENALAIDCTQVLIVPSRSLVGQTLEDASSLFTDSLAQLSGKAEQLGVRLGIESLNPMLSDYASRSTQVMAFIDAIGSDSLGVVLDTGHICLSGEDFASAMENVGSRLMEVHFNDNDGKIQLNAVPGEGIIDFPAVFRMLQSHGYNGFVTMELGWQYSPDPQPALKLALERTRALQALA